MSDIGALRRQNPINFAECHEQISEILQHYCRNSGMGEETIADLIVTISVKAARAYQIGYKQGVEDAPKNSR